MIGMIRSRAPLQYCKTGWISIEQDTGPKQARGSQPQYIAITLEWASHTLRLNFRHQIAPMRSESEVTLMGSERGCVSFSNEVR